MMMMNKPEVVRPIPKRVSEQYYHEAHQEGLNFDETNQGVMLAHEWHRRWTQQEEMNHTTPDHDFYDDIEQTLLPEDNDDLILILIVKEQRIHH